MPKDTIGELKRRVDEQCRALVSLASSLEGEDMLGELMRRVEKPCEALSSLAAGAAGEGFVLNCLKRGSCFCSMSSLSVMNMPMQGT